MLGGVCLANRGEKGWHDPPHPWGSQPGMGHPLGGGEQPCQEGSLCAGWKWERWRINPPPGASPFLSLLPGRLEPWQRGAGEPPKPSEARKAAGEGGWFPRGAGANGPLPLPFSLACASVSLLMVREAEQ